MKNIEDSYPLSPMQQGMLFHSQYAPHSGVYIQQLVCALKEELNVSALKQAWQRLTERHASLRTTFRLAGSEEPLQEVQRYVSIPWKEEDWRSLAQDEQEARLEAFIEADRLQDFEFAKAPLMRLALFRTGEANYRMLWTFHHALLDGRSYFLALKELFAVYEAICQGQHLQLTQLRPYRDYIDWLQKQDWTTGKQFWTSALRGVTNPTPLGIKGSDLGQPAKNGFGRQEICLDKSFTAALRKLAQEHQLTVNSLLQGAWALLLSHYSGEGDVVFGTTRSGRYTTVKGAESMVGLFINTLPLRARVSRESSLLPWLQEIRAHWIAMRDFEHTPLVQIQAWSDIPAGKPLFDSILIFENYDLNSALRAQGKEWEKRDFRAIGTTNYALTVIGYLDPELLLEISYDRCRFDENTITRMAGHFQTLLEGIVADPGRRLSELPILTEAERDQLLVEWNETKKDYHKDQCVHQLFEAQAERTPDAVAVVFPSTGSGHGEGEQLTYRELNRRANQLAHYLQKLGVEPEVLVGICMERSLEMVVGILAILKAGGAYVPLDPGYPRERLAFMLEDAQAKVLLTQQRLVQGLPEHGARVVCLDTGWEAIERESEQNPVSGVTADNLAYVIYTSGSTGKPKGVAMSHRPLCNLISWQLRSSTAPAGARTLQFASTSFDVSFQEIFSTWCSGGTLLLISEELRRDAAGLLSFLRDRAVERLFLPFVALHHLARVIDGERQVPIVLREIITAGEQLQITPQIASCFKELGSCTLHNQYGPSESHVVTAFTLMNSPSGWPTLPPIGRPIANAQIYLLDSHLQPVPIGIPGELYIGGDGLARGYLNRPELTAERFIPNPFSKEAAASLYRTGDLARYSPDGNIEFLGRIDSQVKIRGFRIELGEIEAVLGQHPAVREVVVLAREDEPGEKRLVAYVVARQGQLLTIDGLRSFLKQKLPEYMIPTAFVMLDALPLTPSGKVSRRDLPAPDTTRPELKGAFVAPRSPIEEALAQIWTEVLRLEQVGVHDNFFDLGGHSLLATQVISRLREILQVELPLRNLFEAPTVAGLAEKVIARGPDQSLGATPIVPVPREGTLPLSFTQQRLWFLDQLEPGSTAYNMPVAFRLTGPLNVAALERSINEIGRRHETLRTTFSVMDGETVQIIAPTLTLILVLADLSGLPEPGREAEVSRLSAEEAQRPFDLAQGALLRATLLRLGDDEHTLLLTMHHIISDGWSMAVLFRELEVFYEAFSRGKPSPLPELAIQYADFAVWQRQWLQGEVLKNQVSYWRGQLAGAPAVLELPTDRPRPAVQTYRGARQSLVLSLDLSEGLRDLSRQNRATLFMTLLAAFKILLCRYSGQEDIVVGSPIAGRNRAEIEGLIGFFISTLVLRADLSGNPTFRELLGRVREVCLGAYAHQELPFEKLVEELHPERDLSHTPLFQVFFNMISLVEDRTVKLAGLKVEPFGVKEEASKFDLTMYVRDHGGRLLFSLVYNTDLFDAATITRMLGHYRTLLEGIVANPDQPISSLSLLTEEERSQLSSRTNLIRATNPFVEFRKEEIEQSIPSRFERQVERYPDHVAVRTKEQRWSYRELNRMANQAAHTLLRACGSGEQRVGLLFGHGAPMIAGILAVLKAGKTYVPLDPTYPTERLAYVLEDSQATALLTDSSNMGFARTLTNGTLQVIDIGEAKEAESADNPDLAISPDTLAYILYTSGSTGQPKGVMQNHRNVLHFIRAYTNSLHVNAGDRLTLFSSYSHDAAIVDIFSALLNGATLYPWGVREQGLDGLAEWLIEGRATIYHSTPTLYQSFVDTLDRGVRFSELRAVVLGGETVLESDFVRFKEHFSPECIFFNLYGSTESTINLLYSVSTESEVTRSALPVGYPVEETEVLLLDQAGRRAEVYGEIGIRSAHVALGYWQRPEMTGAAFVADPEGRTKRIYRTGDMGRLLPDGSIGFIGRKDFQVKIRGFRIELGEVEAVLSQHPGVRESIVLVREDQPGEKRLVGYVVLHQKPGPTIDELRSFLKQKLPDYMVPSAFVMLEALPLTPNGKVSRRDLPAPDTTRPELKGAFVAPRSPIEEALAQIWTEVLRLEQVGVHDNFFDLGGHSLLATQVMSRLHAAFQVELPLRNLFEAPTVAGLAEHIETLLWAMQGRKTSATPMAGDREAIKL